nr:MAG TPA: hypothetical protein [Crassvirales sp.]
MSIIKRSFAILLSVIVLQLKPLTILSIIKHLLL